ncbi:hypothetical protein [Paraburkholderia hospita]|uniref:hypothetical protein n=1 Tax=Paraburkholderia hospita TaxID=169430 RepID=UPI000B3412C6|nr:hypothetical protein [Paraburkholderia hospita]OUL97150.1 hypothetical protein CA601_00750 [Paraburkholderia hospita]
MEVSTGNDLDGRINPTAFAMLARTAAGTTTYLAGSPLPFSGSAQPLHQGNQWAYAFDAEVPAFAPEQTPQFFEIFHTLFS